MQKFDKQQELYQFLEHYAVRKNLTNMQAALPMMKEYMSNHENKEEAEIHYTHALNVTKILIDLDMKLMHNEEDLTLSTALTHIIPECYSLSDLYYVYCEIYGLNRTIPEIVQLIVRKGGIQDEPIQRTFYQSIENNKIATLVKLADRSDVVCSLNYFTVWQSKEFIYETRKFFYPLCIIAKEKYPDCYGAISILMEKMRTVIDGSEILINRFEERESELNLEIIQLKEENAFIRSILKKYTKNN